MGNFKAGPFSLRYFDTQGEKNVCLVIGSALFYSRAFHKNFEKSYRMIYLDHRGFGSVVSEVRSADYDFEIVLKDIENFRVSNDLGKICIIGHSAHGYMALEYAKRFKDSVLGVCIVATGPSHGIHMIEAEKFWQETVAPGRKSQFETDMTRLESNLVLDPNSGFVLFCQAQRAKSWVQYERDISIWWQGVKAFMPAIEHLYGQVFRDIKIEDGLAELDLPVLIALGKYDYQVAPFWTWNPYKSLFRRLTFKIFENSSHNPQIEESELFYIEFRTWFITNKVGDKFID